MLLLAVLAACNGGDESVNDNNDAPDTQEEETAGGEGSGEAQALEPDVEGIPEVVAEVNGEEIEREAFEMTYAGQYQQMAMQLQMSGQEQEIDEEQLKAQVLESMIGQELLIQEADSRNFDISDDDINELIDESVEQNGLESREQLMSAFEEQGTNEEEVMAQIETQVKVNKLIEYEVGDYEPSETELEEYYDQIVAQQTQSNPEVDIPPFDEVRPEIEQQLVTQRENEAVQTLVTTLHEDADITNHM